MDGLNNDCDLWNGENCVSVKRVSTPTGWNNISIEHIRGCNGANCVSRKKDTIQQSSAGVPISPLPKPDNRYESLYHAINSMPQSTLKNLMLQVLTPSAVSTIIYDPLFSRTLQLKDFYQSHKQ